MTIRAGQAFLSVPEHNGGQVPEDFIILLGIAGAFGDPSFRAMMKAFVETDYRDGLLDGILRRGGDRLN